MADEQKYKIPLFDGNNFTNWKFRMEVLLDELELLEHVQKSIETKITEINAMTGLSAEQKTTHIAQYTKNDKACKSQIVRRVAESHLEYVMDQATAFDIWVNLSNHFARKGVASQLLIRKALLSMKFNQAKETIEAHFLKFDGMIRDLRSTGATLEETDVVCHLLLTMPSEYETVVTAIETMHAEQLTLSFVKRRLQEEELKKQSGKRVKSEVQSSTAFAAGRGKSKTNFSQNKTKYKCHGCGETGHFRADCPKIHKGQHSKNTHSRQANIAAEVTSEEDDTQDHRYCFSAYIGKKSEDSVWCLDSGASEHLVSNDKFLKNVKNLKSPVKIKSAKSGAMLISSKVGEIHVKSLVENELIDIVITDVLYVPGLETNLLSVRKLEINGFTVIFKDGKGAIMKRNKVIAVADRKSKLYELNFQLDFESANFCKVEKSTELWHKRLGHISNSGLRKLKDIVDGIDIDVKPESSQVCEHCIEGKQTKLPHNQKRVRAKRPLQLIHSDLFGPVSPNSYDEKRYILTFIDDFTHFTVVYALSSKSEVFRYFKMYEAMAVAHFNLKISRFRCDNGREYISKEIKDYFENRGIQFEFTIRHTPQQNGVAERMNRTIVEKARCMLLNAQMNKCFWTEAVLAAVYLINRCPTESLKNKVPAELWYGERPNLKKLKTFGCIAYLHLPKALVGGKFNSRTKKCVMVGYCVNGYRLWSPEERKIFFGRDVIFDEGKFQGSSELDTEADWNPDMFNDKITDTDDLTQQESDLEYTEDENFASSTEKNQTQSTVSTNSKKAKSTLEKCTLRCSTREKKKPERFKDYDMGVWALNAEAYIDEVPETYDDIKNRDDKEYWYRAVKEEMDALLENDTWTLVELPSGQRAIDNKWVFKIKRNEYGNVDRYKARLVVKGCSQRKGFDYGEVYAPVARLTTVRILFSIINNDDLFTCQMDVKNAFLHGQLQEDIFMKQPQGLDGNSELVCKLNKTLYGLKQAPRAWNARFDEFIKRLGFAQSEHDRCLYTRKKDKAKTYLLLYVDDIIIASNNENELKIIKASLKQEFCMTDLGELHYFLGIKIDKSKEGLLLSQSTYLKNLLQRFNMEDCKPSKTPMEEKPSALVSESSQFILETKPYRELVGCLMYAMLTTRPDLSAAVNYYSRFQSNATESHWKGLKRILRYIKDTVDLALLYRKTNSPPLVGYADSDWAGALDDRKSTTGYLFEVFGAVVTWTTRKQTTVSLSSTEAEYIALSTAAEELVWLKNLLQDFGNIIETPIVMYEDNQPCIHLLNKWEHRRLKHIDVKYNFVKDLSSKKIIDVKYLQSSDQKADILTKGLAKDRFVKLRDALGLVFAKI